MKKIINYLVILLTTGISLVSAHESNDYYGHHSMMGGFHSNYGMFVMYFFGWIIMILVIVALVLLIMWLFKQLEAKPRRKKK